MAVNKPVIFNAFKEKIFILIPILLIVQFSWAVDKVSVNGNHWYDAGTWSPSGVPAAGDNVTIQHNVQINNEGLTLSAGTITVKAGSTLTVNGGFTITSTAYVIVEEGATLISNGGTTISGGTFDVYGSTTGHNNINISNNGNMIIRETGYVLSSTNVTLTGNANVQIDGLLNMTGQITGTSNTIIHGTGDITTCCTINSDGSVFGIKPYNCSNNCSNPNQSCVGNGGSITNGNINVCLGSSVTITSTAASTMSGTLIYQWQSNVNNSNDGWVTIPSSNSVSLTVSPSTTLYYRRRVKSNNCTAYKTATNTARVVVQTALNPGTIGGAGTICPGNSRNLTNATSASGSGTLTYLWQRSTDNITWSNISGTNNTAYTANPGPTVNTYYRRRVTSNICNTSFAYSNSVLVSVYSLEPGTIAGNQTVCPGVTANLTNSNNATGPATLTYTWQSSPNNSTWTNIASSNNVSYSTTVTNNTYFRRSVISSSCALGTQYSNSVLVTINNITNTWTGATNTTWNTASNWSCGVIPNTTTDAIIANVSNDPAIGLSASVKTLTLESGSELTISGANTLTVTGDLINNGATLSTSNGTILFAGSTLQKVSGATSFKHITLNNPNGLEFESGIQIVHGKINLSQGSIQSNNNLILDLTQEGMIVGPSAASGSESITGNITVKRTITAIAPNTFHYIATPLGSGTIADFNDDQNYISSGYASYYYYDETVRNADKDVGFLAFRNTNGTIGGSSLKGFALYQKNISTEFDVTGPYNHYAAYNNVPLSFTTYTTGTVDQATSNEADGWHLIGNPYPGPLDWDVIYSNSTNLAGAFYVYNNATGTIGVYGGGGAYVNVTSKFIPAMQSFFVRAVNTGATISINHAARATENPSSPSFYRLSQPQLLKFTLTDSSQQDQTIIRFMDETSSDYEPQYDAIKFYNDAHVVSLYSKLNGHTYSINTFSPNVFEGQEVLIGLKNGKSGSYTFYISGIESIDPELSLYLLDQLTNEIYDIRSTNSISFENDNSYVGERFKLVINQPTITSTINRSLANDVKIFTSNNYIVAESNNGSTTLQKVYVYDILGNEVSSLNNVNSEKVKIPVTKEGVYIIKVSIGSEIITRKVFKQ